MGVEEYGQYSLTVNTATILKLALGYLLNIILAVWVYQESLKQNEKPLTWILFTLFFGLLAIILFYLFLLIKEVKLLNQKLDNAQT